MNSNVFEIKNLKKSYGKKTILDIDHLAISRDGITCLMGRNGSGKTTLIRLLALVEQPDSGEILFNGEPLPKSERERLALRRKMGVIWQNPAMFNMTVYQNLILALRLRGIDKKTIEQKAEEISERLSLYSLWNKFPSQLSGGESQKVSIARTLIYSPEIIFVDEPNTYLDEDNQRITEEIVMNYVQEEKKTAIIVTHSSDQAQRLAKNIVRLVNGKVAPGSPE
jgi:tungstate transport system ATP-binding protein